MILQLESEHVPQFSVLHHRAAMTHSTTIFFFLFCPGISVAAVEIRHRKEIKSVIIITHFLIFCINYYQSILLSFSYSKYCNFSYSKIIYYHLIDKGSFALITENLNINNLNLIYYI